VGPDFIAITTYNEKLNQHEIKKVNWSHLKEFEGFVFPNNYGLISSVIKNKHILPHVGFEQHHRDKQIIFCPEISVKGLKSLKVFPLIAMDKPLGTLVVGKKEARIFNFDRENILSRLANFTAISLTNALMYWEMQKLATTDGLTGINNHRRFQESLDDVISRVERYNRQVSLILCDIDHFKLVNDTYGHRMGDNVLKRIARILREEVRGADYVARYGGEEFVIILEETDRKGGKYMAERIREKVQNQVFTSDVGKFSITMSLGICTFPIDAKNKEDLIEKSDQALYYCKEHGRNQSISFDQI